MAAPAFVLSLYSPGSQSTHYKAAVYQVLIQTHRFKYDGIVFQPIHSHRPYKHDHYRIHENKTGQNTDQICPSECSPHRVFYAYHV